VPLPIPNRIRPLPPPPAALADASLGAAERLRACGLRPTHARVFVLDVLQACTSADGCLKPEAIYAEADRQGVSISLPTIYSVLSQLADVQLIDRYRMPDRPAVFSIKRGERRNGHLLCIRCGAVITVFDGDIQQRLRELADAHGFVASEFASVVRGFCTPCQALRRSSS
jgi:Fe2+ or Zn2+ uptake regulation protein